jgi:transposase
MQIRSVGFDLGKTTFHLVALGAVGKVLVRRKFSQRQLLTFTANMPTSLIGLEACSGSHFLGRELRKQGHDVRLARRSTKRPNTFAQTLSRPNFPLQSRGGPYILVRLKANLGKIVWL